MSQCEVIGLSGKRCTKDKPDYFTDDVPMCTYHLQYVLQGWLTGWDEIDAPAVFSQRGDEHHAHTLRRASERSALKRRETKREELIAAIQARDDVCFEPECVGCQAVIDTVMEVYSANR